MDMPLEDLLEVRKLVAEMGRELTPGELGDIFNEVEDVQIVDGPGLTTELRESREDKRWRDNDRDQSDDP